MRGFSRRSEKDAKWCCRWAGGDCERDVVRVLGVFASPTTAGVMTAFNESRLGKVVAEEDDVEEIPDTCADTRVISGYVDAASVEVDVGGVLD
jgi:hypothetical protein